MGCPVVQFIESKPQKNVQFQYIFPTLVSMPDWKVWITKAGYKKYKIRPDIIIIFDFFYRVVWTSKVRTPCPKFGHLLVKICTGQIISNGLMNMILFAS